MIIGYDNMDVVDKIIKNDKSSLSTKIIRLWCVWLLNYRQELGDKSMEEMKKLTNEDYVVALSFISGLQMGGCKIDVMKKLVPELKK